MALKLMRDNLKHLKWVLWFVVIVFVLLVFVDWGSGRGQQGPSNVAVQVGDHVVTEQQFLREVRENEQRLRNLYGDQWEQFRSMVNIAEQTAQQIIQRELLMEEARKAGLVVSERELQDQILSYQAFRRKDGSFVGQDIYARILRANQTTPEQFEARLREDLLIQKLQNTVRQAVLLSDEEVEQEIRKRRETADLDVIVIPVRQFLGEVTAGDAEVQAYYEAHRDEFTRPEQRVIRYLVVETNTLRRLLPVNDAEIKSYYEDHIDEFKESEQAHARHILIRVVPGAGPDADAEAKVRAEQVAKLARSGVDFATLAEKHSEDPGSRSRGGDLGWFGRGSMVKEFEDAVFGAKPGDIVGPVKSQFGYHIIRVEGFRPARVKPLDEVKDEVRFRLLESRAAAEAERRAAELARAIERERPDTDEAWQKIADEDEAVASFVSPPFGADEVIPGIGQNPELRSAVFEARVGDIGGPVPISRGWMVWQLKEIRPAGVPPLDEIRDRVAAKVMGEKALAAAKAKGEELARRWREGAEAAELAREVGGTVSPVRAHRRGQPIPGVGPSAALDQLVFEAANGDVVGPVALDENTVAVAKVIALTTLSPEEVRSALASTRASLETERANEILGALLERRRKETVITVDQRLIERFTPNGKAG